jgi:hypothetical protein
VTEPSTRPRRWTTLATWIAAVGACAVCCAGPVVAFFGGLSIVSLAASIWIPTLALVAVAALTGAVWILRRRRNSSCQTGSAEPAGPVDLGIPTPATWSGQPTGRTETGSAR